MREYFLSLSFFSFLPLLLVSIKDVGLGFYRLVCVISALLSLVSQNFLPFFLFCSFLVLLKEDEIYARFFYYLQLLSFFPYQLQPMSPGLSLFCLLLGHYHLVVPKLSQWPLFSAQCLLMTSLIYELTQHRSFSSWLEIWIFVSLYCLPIILLSMSLYLTKIRSLQSATGFLYVIFFFILSGSALKWISQPIVQSAKNF